MKYLDEYRDGARRAKMLARSHRAARRRGRGPSWRSAAARRTPSSSTASTGSCPPSVELVHGPGCPVCVTSLEMIDRAHAIASRPDVIFCSFGDMLRVPGSRGDLLQLKSQGATCAIVYSPLDAVTSRRRIPIAQVVFFAIGFETTAPPNAMAVWLARSARAHELQRAGLARPGAAGDDRDPAVARTTACRASSARATSAP